MTREPRSPERAHGVAVRSRPGSRGTSIHAQPASPGPPVAFESPSAGFVLDWRTLLAMRASGVSVATVTHAAGISSTGDEELDRHLPFDEPYYISSATASAILRSRARCGRIVAIGTTVVRALEHAADPTGRVQCRVDVWRGPRHVCAVSVGCGTAVAASARPRGESRHQASDQTDLAVYPSLRPPCAGAVVYKRVGSGIAASQVDRRS